MTNYQLEMYRQMLLNLRRYKSKGVYIQAKPLFCLALIDWIAMNEANQIKWGDKNLFSLYKTKQKEANSQSMTPIWKPFYYLASEPFYSLVWKSSIPYNNIGRLISPKFLRENLLYAKLDDELWDLLQDRGNREYLKQSIVRRYLED